MTGHCVIQFSLLILLVKKLNSHFTLDRVFFLSFVWLQTEFDLALSPVTIICSSFQTFFCFCLKCMPASLGVMYWSTYTFPLCLSLWLVFLLKCIAIYPHPFILNCSTVNFVTVFFLLQIIIPSISDWEYSWRIAFLTSCCPCTKLQVHRGTRY